MLLLLSDADLVVSGVAVTLLDTAGMRSSTDLVEQLGVERSAAAAAAADVVIMVVDAERGWTDSDGEIFHSLWGKEGPGSRSCKVRGPALLVANKQDLAGKAWVALGGGYQRTWQPQLQGWTMLYWWLTNMIWCEV